MSFSSQRSEAIRAQLVAHVASTSTSTSASTDGPARGSNARWAAIGIAALLAAIAIPSALQIAPQPPPAVLPSTSPTGAPSPDVHPRPDVDAAVVRGTVFHDYEPFASLTDAAQEKPVAAAGRVVDWADGRSIVASGYAQRYAVMAVEIEGPAKTADSVYDSTIYVSIPRGGEDVDDDGEPLIVDDPRNTMRSIDELEVAVPVGTRVIVVGGPTASIEEQEYAPGVKVASADAGLPEGAHSVDPHPQGLLFETRAGGFVSGMAVDEDLANWAVHAAQLAGNDATSTASPGSFENLLSELATALEE